MSESDIRNAFSSIKSSSSDNFDIYLSPPDVGDLEIGLVVETLKSGWIAPLGPALIEFERAVGELTGRKFCVGVSSGTAGLHLSLLAVGVKPGDLVLCPTLTFVASANAISYCGAKPYFVDSSVDDGNLSPSLLDDAIRDIQHHGGRVGAILVVDFLGAVADYSAIESLALGYGIPVVSDSAESIGATREGRAAGGFGAVSVFSFNGNKLVTTSGGGMVLTDDKKVAERVRYLANQARDAAWHYEHSEIGYNYRLSNVLAAIGLGQLARIEEMLAKRRENRRWYREKLSDTPGVSVFGARDSEDNCWLTALVVDSSITGGSARELGGLFRRNRVETRPIWKPLHTQLPYSSMPALLTGAAEQLFLTGLVLPSGSSLSGKQKQRILSVLQEFFRR